jgi:hypothetical protein
MDLIEKNPAAFINPHQPLMTSITGRFISALILFYWQPLMTSITGRFISAIFNTVLLHSAYLCFRRFCGLEDLCPLWESVLMVRVNL